MSLKKLLTPDEVAEFLGVSVQTLAVWRRKVNHPLQFHKIGRQVRYSEEAVMAFLHKRAV